MHSTTLSILALALGTNAIPNAWYNRHRHHHSSGVSGFPSYSAFPSGSGIAAPTGVAPTGGAAPTGIVPSATETGIFSILPVSTPIPTVSASNYASSDDGDDDDDDDDDDDEDEDSDSSSSSASDSDESSTSYDSDSSTSAYASEVSATVTATASDSGSDSSETAATSTAASDSASGSASPVTTTAATTGSSSGGSSGGSLPASSGSSALSAVQTIAAGDSFDGGLFVYDRGVDCTGQAEGGDSDAVFILENGASLSNVIIGPNQIEGVHCEGACTLTNVWWSAVCEDAFTVKEQAAGETTTITGGGAFGAEDKVLQHNGGGTISVSGFTVDNFGKLYRSCGNCDTMYERHVILDDITATEGKILAGINSNYGDTATLTNIKASGVGDICVTYTGNDTGDEPEENGSGPSDSCIYSESDITES